MIIHTLASTICSWGRLGFTALSCGSVAAICADHQTHEWEYVLPHEGDNDGIRSVLEIGDVDGDGIPDVLVGRQGMRNVTGRMGDSIFDARGTVACISGATAAVLWAVEGPSHQDRPNTFGSVMASLGDIDHDGVADIGFGIPYIPEGPTEADAWYPSTVLIVNGKSGRTIREHRGSKDQVDGFGMALAGLGDLDGDGCDDYAIGACNARLYTSGASGRDVVILYSGASGTSICTIDAARTGSAESLGSKLAWLGDVDADGIPDFGVRIDAKRRFGGTWAVFSGKSLRLLFKIEAAGWLIGDDLVYLGDWTGDKLGDLAVLCVDSQDPRQGMFVGLVSGKDGGVVSRANLDLNSECIVRYTPLLDSYGWRLLPTRSSKGIPEEISVISVNPWCAYAINDAWKITQVMTMQASPGIPIISVAAVSRAGTLRSGWLYCGFKASPGHYSIRRIRL